MNCCEHCYGAAPEGKRFCSPECLDCEHDLSLPDNECTEACRNRNPSTEGGEQ